MLCWKKEMKRPVFIIICMAVMTLVSAWYFFNNTRIGVGLRVLGQMVAPPVGLFDNKVDIPIETNVTHYEVLMTNRFVGCYAVRIKVPMEVRKYEASAISPPDILKIKYSWKGGAFEQVDCRKSWSSLNEGPRIFAYKSVLVPIEVPMNKEIKIEIDFPKEAQDFFTKHPDCILSFGKDSDV